MEELLKTAKIYYQASTPQVKESARDFFAAMKTEGADKVQLHEFLGFMVEEGYTQMSNRHFFKELSGGRNELDFWQVMALFYIVKSGRGFCGGCGCLLNAQFFTCVQCFDNSTTPYSVCSDCFSGGLYIHSHQKFLDNFVLLETKRLANLRTQASQVEPEISYGGSTAVVVYSRTSNSNIWKRATLITLNAAIALGSIATSCSVM